MTGAGATDSMSRFVFEGAAVRGARVRMSATSRAILASHAYPPALAQTLAELIGAASLLAAALKFDGNLSVQLVGEGPVRLIVVECNSALALRATAQWDDAAVRALAGDATLETLAGGPQRSRLAITLDPRSGGAIYQGVVELASGPVATTIEHYLTTSEQVTSKLALVVDDGEIAGLILQRMPSSGSADDATWARAVEALGAAAPGELVAAAAADAGLAALFADDDLRVFAPVQPSFECSCSRQRVEGALRIAGRDEIEAALAEGPVEVTCEFCGRRYRFAADEARALFSGAGGLPTQH